jgi:hypothetical protein
MKHWLNRSLLAALLWFLPHQAFAQPDVGIVIEGLASFQPVNDSWVGSPYLDVGIGGIEPGVAGGVNVIFNNGFTVIGEVSTTTAFEQFQRGRLIWTNTDAFHSGSATTRLRDTLFSGLAGYTTGKGSQRASLVGGINGVMTTLTEDDVVVEEQSEFGLDGRRRYALTGGIDFLQRVSRSVAIVIGGRYSWLGRSELADQTGAGEHIYRFGAGVRIGLSR